VLPRVLLLDLDDTILDDSGAVDASWRQAIAEHAPAAGLEAEVLRAEILRASAWFWADPERHRVGRADLLAARTGIVAEALAALGRPDHELARAIGERYAALRHAAQGFLPGALEALERFRAADIPLGLITNGAGAPQRAKLERFGLERFFAYLGIEGEVGVGKPEPAAYEAALAALGARPDETWMVGDRLDYDVAGAQAVGIDGVWVDLAGEGLPADAPVRPARIVRALAELG
jgi:putative hydrolase of the HAD superfamily